MTEKEDEQTAALINFVERIKKNPKPNGTAEKNPPQLSEDELALAFVAKYGADWRYVDAEWKQWFTWSGIRWEAEKTRLVIEKARDLCRDLKASRRLRTALAIEVLSRSDRVIAATTQQWDTDFWKFNTLAGTTELKSGITLAPNPLDYCTKLAGTKPGGKCERWMRFLNEVFDGNGELIKYMQKVVGYCLTGSTREQQLWFLHGGGKNGKSVFVSTISGILGDYAKTTPIENFVASKNTRHQQGVASLMGARLVIANETEEGRRWDESRIKHLTGTDAVTANFMRQNDFTFIPQFKLIVSGNHKPSLNTVDEAIKRRFNLIPFTVTIPEDRRDPDLAEKLKAEWPGILQWMIEGCLLWQKEGLDRPKIVEDATNKYLADEDEFARWIEERCEMRGRASRAELYKSWKEWSELNTLDTLNQKQFLEKLRSKGFTEEYKSGNERGFLHISVT